MNGRTLLYPSRLLSCWKLKPPFALPLGFIETVPRLRCTAAVTPPSLGPHLPPSICISVPPLTIFSPFFVSWPSKCLSFTMNCQKPASVRSRDSPHQSDTEAFQLYSRTLLSSSSSMLIPGLPPWLFISDPTFKAPPHFSQETDSRQTEQFLHIIYIYKKKKKTYFPCVILVSLLMQFGLRKRQIYHKLKPSTWLGTRRKMCFFFF